MKVIRVNDPSEWTFELELTESELQYIVDVIGQTVPDGFYGLYCDLCDVLEYNKD